MQIFENTFRNFDEYRRRLRENCRDCGRPGIGALRSSRDRLPIPTDIARLAAIVSVICLGLLNLSPAFALPPPGTDLNSAEHKWWECWRQPISQKSCCSEADGHSLNDSDWRAKPDGSNAYQVRVEGQWWDVPPETVINESQKCGPEPNLEHRADAKIWYSFNRDEHNRITSIGVRCFRIGTEY